MSRHTHAAHHFLWRFRCTNARASRTLPNGISFHFQNQSRSQQENLPRKIPHAQDFLGIRSAVAPAGRPAVAPPNSFRVPPFSFALDYSVLYFFLPTSIRKLRQFHRFFLRSFLPPFVRSCFPSFPPSSRHPHPAFLPSCLPAFFHFISPLSSFLPSAHTSCPSFVRS
jgi:hypothetical protein